MAHSQGAKVNARFRAAGSLLRRPGQLLALAVVLGLAAGAGASWRWLQHRAERDEALRLSGQGRFAEAEPLLKRTLERDDRDVAAVRALALGYLGTDNDREADAYLDRWCALQPDRAEPHARRMERAMRRARVEQAIADGERLLEIERGDEEVQRRVAGLLIVANRYADAERACRRFLERNPDSAPLRYLLAEACHLQGKGGEAVALLDPLLRDRPPLTGALLLRAILHGEAGRPEESIPLLRRVLAEDPWNTTARYELSRALARTGQTAEAEWQAAELLRQKDAVRVLVDSKSQPDNLELQARAAEVLLGQGRTEEGLRKLQQILARDPDHPTARRLLAAPQGARRPGGQTGP